jgi:hypothetical protein
MGLFRGLVMSAIPFEKLVIHTYSKEAHGPLPELLPKCGYKQSRRVLIIDDYGYYLGFFNGEYFIIDTDMDETDDYRLHDGLQWAYVEEEEEVVED